MSIKFIWSKASSISFHVISIIASIILKLCLKTTSKQTTKTIKFAIRINQETRVLIIKNDASS
jgi:hypothetical protein